MGKLILVLFSTMLMVSVTLAETGDRKNRVVEVSVIKMRFVPEHITINQGDTVRWVNREKRQYHSVWFEALGEPETDYFFPEESVERVFDQAGVFPYRCGPHPEMLGSVTVNTVQNNSKKVLNEDRQAELTYMVKQDCGSCHGMLLTGGLGPAVLPDNLKDFSAADLAAVILYGRPGTPMPAWQGIVSDSEAQWIATQLKSGSFVDER